MGVGDELRLLELAAKGRIRQHIDTLSREVLDEAFGLVAERNLGVEIRVFKKTEIKQFEELGPEAELRPNAFAGARDLDRHAPELGPFTALVKDFEPDLFGSDPGFESEGKPRGATLGPTRIGRLDVGPRHAEHAGKRDIIDEGAQVRVSDAILGHEPAVDPKVRGRAFPFAGLFDVK